MNSKLKKAQCASEKELGSGMQLGRNGAALCVLVTDQASLRNENRARQPAAYFAGLIGRARTSELSIHKSVFGFGNMDRK